MDRPSDARDIHDLRYVGCRSFVRETASCTPQRRDGPRGKTGAACRFLLLFEAFEAHLAAEYRSTCVRDVIPHWCWMTEMLTRQFGIGQRLQCEGPGALQLGMAWILQESGLNG